MSLVDYTIAVRRRPGGSVGTRLPGTACGWRGR